MPSIERTVTTSAPLERVWAFLTDFTTTEQGYTEGTDDPFGIANNANSPANILTDSLSDAFSRINSLPPIGTSGTSKLLGMIYSGSF